MNELSGQLRRAIDLVSMKMAGDDEATGIEVARVVEAFGPGYAVSAQLVIAGILTSNLARCLGVSPQTVLDDIWVQFADGEIN
jgi:hypothetical protein